MGSTPGSFQGAASSASHLHTVPPSHILLFVNHYSSPATYSANSSIASQGFPSTCGHYATSAVSNAAYPSVSYPSLPAGDPYGQMFTSPNAPTVRPVKDHPFSGQNTAIGHPLPLPPPPSQQHHQQQSLSGYNTSSWSPSGLPPTNDSLTRNHTGSLSVSATNPTSTDSSSSAVPPNVHLPKSSPVVSTAVSELHRQECLPLHITQLNL